jgi:K+-transporting ATPase ATPase C chain
MKTLRPALMMFVLLSLLTGIFYPFLVTGVAQALFPRTANGSIIEMTGEPIGSDLIGQQFSSPGYFWGRPSATKPRPYNAASSGGSNLGPLNPALVDAVRARVQALRTADPNNTQPVPVDLATASASGLDPDISLAAAYYQAPRVARARGLPIERVRATIADHAKHPWLGFLGEPRVNVLELNIALDGSHT